MPRNVILHDFLTDDEIKQAMKLWRDDRSNFHRRCLEEIIRPNIDRINKALGQENNPDFLAYAVEYVMSQVVP